MVVVVVVVVVISFSGRLPQFVNSAMKGHSILNTYRGADNSLDISGKKQANVSVRMSWISFGALPCRQKKNLMSARVSMLLKSRASLTCYRACFLPGRDLSAPRYESLSHHRFGVFTNFVCVLLWYYLMHHHAHDNANILLVLQIIRDMRRPSAHYFDGGRFRFRFAQVLVNAVALLAIAGGLAAYFRGESGTIHFHYSI